MADAEYRSVEDVFNRNVEALLESRDLTHRDLLDLLEKASYTADTPATVLLNDAVAIAAVLGVSPLQLLIPTDEASTDVTPEFSAESRLLGLWLRGLRPLLDADIEEFFRGAPLEDLDANLVAENWVWSERLRTTALVFLLNDAVDQQDLDRVRVLSELAGRQLDQPTLEQADGRVDRFVPQGELRAALERAARYRRQTVGRRPQGTNSGSSGP